MELIITRDAAITAWSVNPNSGSGAWGPRHAINPALAPALTTAAITAALAARLPADQLLCITCHGHDTEIGDAGNGPADWGWTAAQMAGLLTHGLGAFHGKILINACACNVANFSAGLAVALHPTVALRGVWIYGFNRSIPIHAAYPPPIGIEHRVDIQGTQV